MHTDDCIDIAIIGGGLAGIACALALRESGLTIAIFERESACGGRAASHVDRTTNTAIDLGPHIVLTEYRNLLDMLGELGTRDDLLWQTDRFITLLDAGDRIPMRIAPLPAPFHLLPSLLRVRQLSARDKASNARITWLALRASEADRLQLDDLSARELLNRCGVSERFQRWFWSTATLALLNVPLEECSAAAALRMYAQLIGTSGYRSGFAVTPLAQLFVPSAEALLNRHGIHVHRETEVVRIGTRGTHLDSVHLKDGRTIKTNVCVTAIPPADLARLLDASGIGDARWQRMLSRFEPSAYISTYLWFDRKLTHERFWGRIWSPANLNTDFYDLSNIRRDLADSNRSLIASNSVRSNDRLHLPDDEIVGRTLAELYDFAPSAREARLLHAVVNRIPMAIACPKPATELARPDAITPINGLLLAGDWTNTHLPSCMESAVYSGRAAAEYILNGQACRHSATLPPPDVTGIAKLIQRLSPRPQIARWRPSTVVSN